MPLYEYHCKRCDCTFEMLRSIKDADCKAECPKCGSSQIERQFSTFSASGCGPRSRGFT